MPPTISVTVGRDEAAAFEAVALVAVAPAVPLELPELLQAATPAARAATLATLASLIRVGLGMGAPWCVNGGGGLGSGVQRAGGFRRRRLRPGTAGARTAGAAPAGRSGPRRSAPRPR